MKLHPKVKFEFYLFINTVTSARRHRVDLTTVSSQSEAIT